LPRVVGEAGNYQLVRPERELQAIVGAVSDLRKADEMLQHCVETDTELHEVCEELEEACWTTAVVRYERAFACRPWPSQAIVLDNLSPQQLETHHFIRFLRDKMFAHAIGGIGEDFEVTAFVSSTYGGGLGLIGVGPRPRYIVSPGADFANEFLDLVRFVFPLVSAYRWKLQNDVRQKLQAMPVEQVVKGLPIEQAPLTLDRASNDFQKYLRKATGQKG
jgi:hypothetical protein